jgi:hypothetical protein
MDGDGRGGCGVGVNDAPTDRPPAPYPLALSGSGRCLPCCFLLLGLRAEIRTKIKIFYFLFAF